MQLSKKFATRFLPTLLCLLAMALTACGSSSPGTSSTNTTHAAANKQILVLPEQAVADIKTFDAAMSTDLESISAIDMVFTGLVQLDDKLQVQPQLAAALPVVSPDGLTYTFKLKPNLKFSDGAALTSQDVVYSIDRALDPNLKSETSPIYLALINHSNQRLKGKTKSLIGDSLLAPDSQTVIIKISQKAAYFLDALTYSCSYVVEKSMITRYGNNFADHLSQGIGGAGPFIVSKYTHNQDIEFIPNPHYYGPKPQLTKVIFPFYKEGDTAYDAYKADQLDQSSVPVAQIAQAKGLPNGQFHQTPLLWINYYTMNYLAKPFNNIKIRQAFDLAIDKDVIARDIQKDAVIATNHIVPNGMPGYNANLTGPNGVTDTKSHPDMAKQLFQQGMQEEGYTAANFPTINISAASGGRASSRNEFAVMQQMWHQTLGVNVKINDEDFNKLLDDITNTTNKADGLQMYRIDWIADYPDAQDWLTLQFDNGVPNNNANYGQNKTSDAATQQQTQKLMEQADQNPNAAQRIQQYNKAEQQLVNDVAWLPVDQQTAVFVRKACVVGTVDNAQELTPPDDWAAIYISTDSNCAKTDRYA